MITNLHDNIQSILKEVSEEYNKCEVETVENELHWKISKRGVFACCSSSINNRGRIMYVALQPT